MTQMEYIWKLYNYKWSTNKGYYFSIGISSLKEVTNYIKKKKKKIKKKIKKKVIILKKKKIK